jgi:NAD(P)-dependent dehydrogenase (short-subunit alcohol dehydrogenase family)
MALGLGLAAGLTLVAVARRQLYSFRDRTVIITGGSRGLGLLMARRLAAENARLVLLARDKRELKRAEADLVARGAADVLTVTCDIRVRDAVEQAVQQTAERMGRIDVLINNAGIIQVGPLEHMTVEDFKDAMDVHLWGPLYATLAVVPHMRREGEGRIVNITSIGARIAVPHLIPYCASKFALFGLSEGLHCELRQHGIKVTTVCPNLMRTGSPVNAMFKGRHRDEFAWFAISDSLPLISMNADRAAERIIEACRRGKARLTLTPHAKAAVLLNDLLPGLSAGAMALANRLLPGPAGEGDGRAHPGWRSTSRWAPSALTVLSNRAAAKNFEQPW